MQSRCPHVSNRGSSVVNKFTAACMGPWQVAPIANFRLLVNRLITHAATAEIWLSKAWDLSMSWTFATVKTWFRRAVMVCGGTCRQHSTAAERDEVRRCAWGLQGYFW